MIWRASRRMCVLTVLASGTCAVDGGCGGSSSSSSAPVDWSAVESKVDPKLLVKKAPNGKGTVAVDREERRRILLDAKKKIDEGQ